MGCAFYPIPFVAAFEIILSGARQMVEEIKLPSAQKLSPLKSNKDDVTNLLETAPCIFRLLEKTLLMAWAGMKIRSAKRRRLSL